MKPFVRFSALFLTVWGTLLTVSTSGLSQTFQPRAESRGIERFHPRDPIGHLPIQSVEPNGGTRRLSLPSIASQLSSQLSVIDTAVIWSAKDTLRELFTFDAQGKRTLALLQKLDGELWADSMRQTSTYDERGNMLSDTYEFFSTAPLPAENLRVLYSYDESDRVLVYERQVWDLGQWTPVYRRTYTYGPPGEVLTDLRENWSRATAQWINTTRTTNVYDAEGLMVSFLEESWSSGAWQNSDRSTIAHDVLGRDSSIFQEQWQGTSWKNIALSSLTYDSLGNCVTSGITFWRDDHWEQSYRLVMIYDTGGRLLQRQEEWWRGTLSWVPDSRDTWVYDGNGRQLYWMAETWIDNQWVKQWRWDYTYDANGALSQWMASVWMESGWTLGNSLVFGIVDSLKNEYWFYDTYGVKLHQRTIQTGVELANGQVPEAYTLFQNYPNPFNPTTTVRYALPKRSHTTLTVFNTLGQRVATLVNGEVEAGHHVVQFNGSGLASGVYFYRLQAGSYTQARTLSLIR